MNTLTHIKPVENRIVPDPYMNDALPAEGRKVELDQYWNRRLLDGDITIVEEPAPKSGKATKQPN